MPSIKSPRVVLLDIDNTIFDTEFFMQQLVTPQVSQLLQITPAQVRELRADFVATLPELSFFTPQKWSVFIADCVEKPEIAPRILDILLSPQNHGQSLYSDVQDFFNDWKDVVRFGIFSQGEVSWQRLKLSANRLFDYLDPQFIFIDWNKTSETVLSSLPEHALLVDDRADILSQVNLHRPDIATFRMNRQTTKDDTSICSLKELEPHLQ